MLKKYISILFVGILCFSGVAYAGSERGLNLFAYPRETPQTPIYNPYGGEVRLNDFKGNFVLAIFWSKHCVPCIRELDDLNNFVLKTKDTGIKAILISKAEEWNNVEEQQKFLKKFKAQDVEFYVDKKGKLTDAFGIFSSPHTVLINKKGEEIGRIRGSVDWDDEDVIEYIYSIKSTHGDGETKNDR